MSRKKQYIEEDVVEKAMHLFWVKGYEHTSLQMLEKQMGINKFSIYSTFGSKDGLYIESLKLYRQRVGILIKEIEASNDAVLAIKAYFYKFLRLSAGNGLGKGCFIGNTLNEIDANADLKIVEQVEQFRHDLRHVFCNQLLLKNGKEKKIAEAQADYLMISMIGLSSASKVCTHSQLENYIENIFKGL
ncbi:TetR/AcrR family transcriptional regulator [Winogradskyella sp. F6397]|uniref:TetR/AcrR family transcriptional regulator n=1 Tax=Winogradskyella marina TaxID=2785530 RepID=A0ABS0EJP3_9FLAO|nr:TetR/AcrR family transcriptional regulator [Winogradskyella marina]MBF8150587.1 TetR/AcrR family transcriptional regulator [Winogradskyella marina]